MLLPTVNSTMQHIAEQFIGKQLPDWLGKASAEGLTALRVALAAHLASQVKMSNAYARLQPLGAFAQARLESRLGLSVALDQLTWREERRRLILLQGAVSEFESYFVRVPALQKLMQNFKARESFFQQTALVTASDQPNQEQVVSLDIDAIVAGCRSADVGKAYQKHLASILDTQFQQDLAVDKRLQLALSVEIAALKGQLQDDDLRMLRQVGSGTKPMHPYSRRVEVGGLHILGCRVEGALAIELLGSWISTTGQIINHERVEGVMLYLPDDTEQPLQRYTDWPQANRALAKAFVDKSYRQAFARRIALDNLGGFLTLLATRLKDDKPDMQPRKVAAKGDVFSQLSSWHVERIKLDAQFIAVPTEKADSKASAERLQVLEGAGLALLNLAGLFVPGVGALLLADMVRQMLGEVFEGASDWSQGHQHEALQHMVQVATSLAATGAVAGGVYATRSLFVETLQPITNEADQARLWRNDLTPYREVTPPPQKTQLQNGLFTDGSRHWWYCDQVLYKVRKDANGTWRLLHSDGPGVFGPVLESNGERAWRLTHERPLEWQGSAYLLSRLWPTEQAMDAERVACVLKVADIDEAYLRGLLVEGRPMPVQLRDTLERFAVDERIETFFAQLGANVTDTELFQWCVDDLGVSHQALQAQAESIKLYSSDLRERMFKHFSSRYLTTDSLQSVLTRDFPGLPDAYALDVLSHADQSMRTRMQTTARLPLALGERARSALQQARLTRAREAFYLRSSYQPEAVALAFALLRRHGLLRVEANLELRQGAALGRLQERLLPEESGQRSVVMVWHQGAFQLYDERGLASEIELAEPGGLFEVLAACLPGSYRERYEWSGVGAGERVRSTLQGWIPADSTALLRLLGWREARPLGASMRRLADGRQGYLLGGRASRRAPEPDLAELVLRDRIRSLYPAFDDDDVDRYLLILQTTSGSPFNSVLSQEQQYRRLDESLHLWADEVTGTAHNDRERVAYTLRSAWRLEGEQAIDFLGSPTGLRVSIVATPVGALPTLPEGTDFSHVSELALVGLGLETLPPGFLGNFAGLRQLDLSNNALRALPEGLDDIAALRHLSIRRNRVRLNAAQALTLTSHVQLRSLDMSENPLGAVQLDFTDLNQLRDLRVRRAGLTIMPEGLQWCAQLEYADLRDNQISELPEALLEAPEALRHAVNVNGNALSVALMERLRAPAPVPTLPAVMDDADAQARQLWLTTVPDFDHDTRTEQWQALHSEPDSEAFFEVIAGMTQSAEFRLAPEDLGTRVWTMIEALVAEQRMRQELFELAAEPRACADNLANCFSTLEVRLQVLQATDGGEPIATRAARLLLAQRLFRLDAVLALARVDIQHRYAQGRWQHGAHAEEEVEVSLAYRTGLAERLNLIGQPRHMLFRNIAGVTQADLDRAYQAVLADEAGEARIRYISQRDFWLAVLRAEHPAEFEAIEQKFDKAMEALEMRMHSLGSGPYDAQARQLMRSRQEALDALALDLTREEMRKP